MEHLTIVEVPESLNPEHHTCQEDKESGLCRICHVEMTEECGDCQGIGYHQSTCPQINGYDYRHQAWVVDGKYVACGHGRPCNSYGTLHHGQPVAKDADVH